MNIRMIAQILGRVLLIMAALLLLPFVTGLVYAENILPFAVTIALTAAVGGALLLLRPHSREIYAREGFAAVGLSWLSMSLLGALPFVLSGNMELKQLISFPVGIMSVIYIPDCILFFPVTILFIQLAHFRQSGKQNLTCSAESDSLTNEQFSFTV